MSEQGDSKPQRILVVDDDALNCELVAGLLMKQGYVADTETDSERATQKAIDLQPDLVVLDVMMPGLNGYEVCADMKAAFGKRFLPIILLTALEDIESLLRGFDAGADDFVSKPFEPRVLMARVQSGLRTKALWDELAATQKRLIDAERMAAIGEMTVTLKHEINNPLQTIVGYADYLLSVIPADHEFYSQIDAICKGGERIAELLSKLDQVRRVETTEYLGTGRMVDLDKSTDAAPSADD